MDIGERIRDLLKIRRLSQTELARALDVADSFVSNMIHGKAKISLDNLSSICAFLDISLAEFFAPTAVSEQEPQYMIDFLSYCRKLSSNDIEALIPIVKRLEVLRNQHCADSKVADMPQRKTGFHDHFYSTHVRGEAAAGLPVYSPADWNDDQIAIPEKYSDPERFFPIRARGDSMEPRIHSGDIVIVQKDAPAENGEVALVRLAGLADDEYTIKRVYLSNGILTLRSYNPAYPPMTYSAEDVRSCDRVVHVMRHA